MVLLTLIWSWLSAAIKALVDVLYMLQECNPHPSTKDWKVVKVEEHEGDVIQAVLVLNKESVAPIETARGVLNFGGRLQRRWKLCWQPSRAGAC